MHMFLIVNTQAKSYQTHSQSCYVMSIKNKGVMEGFPINGWVLREELQENERNRPVEGVKKVTSIEDESKTVQVSSLLWVEKL